jgi:hypothetical protein
MGGKCAAPGECEGNVFSLDEKHCASSVDLALSGKFAWLAGRKSFDPTGG